MPPFEIHHLDALKEFEGRELPPTDWLVVTQERIQKFAEVTEDAQWIHVDSERAARESPHGCTIAHGFLTLSLLSRLVRQAVRICDGVKITINRGLNRVRFTNAVPAGSAIRARITPVLVNDGAEFVDAAYSVIIEIQGSEKPACVADWLLRYYRA